MSSFKIMATHKASGEIHEVWCLDDYFGKHKYGCLPNIEDGEAMNVDDFERKYTVKEPTP